MSETAMNTTDFRRPWLAVANQKLTHLIMQGRTPRDLTRGVQLNSKPGLQNQNIVDFHVKIGDIYSWIYQFYSYIVFTTLRAVDSYIDGRVGNWKNRAEPEVGEVRPSFFICFERYVHLKMLRHALSESYTRVDKYDLANSPVFA